MKNVIRNRRIVALETTKLARGYGKNPDAALQNKVNSRRLYDQGKYLTLQREKKGHPTPRFERAEIEHGLLAWMPVNDAARDYFRQMTDEEKYEFMFHPPPQAKPRPCESKRVVDGCAIKGLPNGIREADVFPSERSPRKTTIRADDGYGHQASASVSTEQTDYIRNLITQSSLK